MGNYYKIRGKNIYTEVLGKETSAALLYVHGGPGGIGSVDFVKNAGKKLSQYFRVIAPDQRGVWSSEEIGDEEDVSIEDIIEDFEELRRTLHIERWYVLSHSFGGYIAVLYANMYPDSIEYMVYENPSFDFSLSERSMLKYAADELIKCGKGENSQKYFRTLKEINDYKEINKVLMESLKDLGSDCNNFMWFGEDKNLIEKMAISYENGAELWTKSMKTRFKMLKDWRVYNDVFKELGEIKKPSLLIKGKYDPITCEKQVEEFMKNADRKIAVFDKSSHYVHVEESDKYCEVVWDYILSKR